MPVNESRYCRAHEFRYTLSLRECKSGGRGCAGRDRSFIDRHSDKGKQHEIGKLSTRMLILRLSLSRKHHVSSRRKRRGVKGGNLAERKGAGGK